MHVFELEIFQPKQIAHTLIKLADSTRNAIKSYVSKSRRTWKLYARNQYFLSHALADSRRSFQRNEDIILGCLIVIAVLNFSASSVFANTLYMFMVTATVLAELSGVSLFMLAIMALGVVGVSLLWLVTFLQNMITVPFFESLSNKRRKSLRNTIRISLEAAPRVAIAWLAVISISLVPFTVIGTLVAAGLFFKVVQLENSFLLMAALLGAGLAGSLTILINASFAPYIMLFSKQTGVKDAVIKSYRLARRNSRALLTSTYGCLAIALTGLYALSGYLEKATGLDAGITFLTLSVIPLSVVNIIFTMLYRKRKLARS